MTEIPGTLPGEEWRRVPNIPEIHVSNKGRCYREPGFAMMRLHDGTKLRPTGGGIVASAQVSVGNQPYTVMALIATAWIGPKPFENLVVRFKDGNKANRNVSNLVWAVRNTQEKIPSRCFDTNGRPIKLEQNQHDRGR